MIASSKVVYAPITRIKDGEEKVSFLRLGVKVVFDNGVKINGQTGEQGYLFYSYKHKSYSITRPAFPMRDCLNRVIDVKGKVQWHPQKKGESMNQSEYLKRMSQEFRGAVALAIVSAEMEDAMKRTG